MRPRTLLVLLAVVLGLGAFIWFYERALPGSEERERLAQRAVPGLEEAEVTAVVVEQGDRSVRLERVAPPGEEEAEGEGADGTEGDAEDAEDDPFGGPPAEWRIAAPQRWAGARADAAAVEGLVSALGALDKLRTLDDPDPGPLGLEPPRARVTLEVAGGEPYVVALGAEVPASRGVVLARPDRGEVHVVDGSIAADLLRDPGDWRDPQVFPVGRGDVRRVALRGGGGDVVLAADEGGFRVVEPFADRADRDAVEQLLAELVRLRADRFVDAPPAGEELGLDPPRGVVEVAAEGRLEPVRLEVGAEAADGSGTWLRLAGQTFTATTQAPAALARPASDWRSRRLAALEAFRVDRVAVSGPGGTTVLERTGSDWTRDGERIPYTPVSDLLYAMTEARAERIEPGAPSGAPSLAFTLTAGAGGGDAAEVSETIELRPPRGGLVPAAVSGRPATLLLPAAAADEIRAALDRVREAEPLGPPPGDEVPEGVELDREEGGG